MADIHIDKKPAYADNSAERAASKRTELARAIGRQMSSESKRKRAQYASATELDNAGATADANRLRRQADTSFDKAKAGMVDRLKKSGM